MWQYKSHEKWLNCLWPHTGFDSIAFSLLLYKFVCPRWRGHRSSWPKVTCLPEYWSVGVRWKSSTHWCAVCVCVQVVFKVRTEGHRHNTLALLESLLLHYHGCRDKRTHTWPSLTNKEQVNDWVSLPLFNKHCHTHYYVKVGRLSALVS